MIDQLSWLGKKEEVDFTKIKFKGKLAGTAWKYQRNIEGLIRTRAIIFAMAILVFYPVLTNNLFYDVFSPGLLIERTIFSALLIASGVLFNKYRILAIALALLPIGLILFSYLTVAGQFDTRKIGFLGAIFLLIGAGFYYHYKASRLKSELEPHLDDTH